MESTPRHLFDTFAPINESIAADHNPNNPHVAMSKEVISRTANFALENSDSGSPRNAIILGGGNCLDIPLDEIVDGFDGVTLVDIDLESTERAVSNLTSQELGKLSIVGADLSGILPAFGSITESHVLLPNFRSFVDIASGLVDRIEPASGLPRFPERFSFVCSQLLLTQLGSLPVLAFRERVQDVYGARLAVQPGGSDEPLLYAINRLALRTQIEHIRYLNQLASQGAGVHLADTYAEAIDTVAGEQLLTMVFPEIIDPVIDDNFSAIAPGLAWTWLQPCGRKFYVASHSLTPRTPAKT